MPRLGPDTAYIFRITHVQNVPWILDHGLHCQNGDKDPSFVSIGMETLISKRAAHPVPIGPGGLLSDYVPFYFTPWSIMLYNIKTGFGDVIQRPNGDIAIVVSSLLKLQETNTRFVFTNGHAYMAGTDFFDDLAELSQIDWKILQNRDFQNNPDDPGKLGRYQAEALAYRHVPLNALLGIVCYDMASVNKIASNAQTRNLPVSVKCLPDWYF
jgi:hypothetical protein